MIGKRVIVSIVAICLGSGLGACSNVAGSNFAADHWPHWAGGEPSDVPPRPGAPGYDEFIAHGGADQAAVKSSAGAPQAPEFVQTGSTPNAGKPALPAKKPSVRSKTAAQTPPQPAPQVAPQVAPQAAPEAAPAEDRSSDDSSVVKGGLY
jgi:hypothetical protein